MSNDDDIMGVLDDIPKKKSFNELVAECRADPELRKIVTEHVKNRLRPDMKEVLEMGQISFDSKDAKRAHAETLFAVGAFQLTMVAMLGIESLQRIKIAAGHQDVSDTGICPGTGKVCDDPKCPFMKGLHPIIHFEKLIKPPEFNPSEGVLALWSPNQPEGEA